jgi:hypothetical protein
MMSLLPLVFGADQLLDSDISLEYQVKSALVFNFARFVTWPAGTFAAPDSPLVIGVYGRGPLTSALKQTLEGKTVEGRRVLVQSVEDVSAPMQILVVSPSRAARTSELIEALASRPVLTVGEAPSFIKHGGMIRLDLAEDKVRFFINQPAVDRAGLVISSQMMQYASGNR